MKFLFQILIASLFLPAVVQAHGFGESFEEQVGEVLVDIGYSTEEFTTGVSTIFDFEILDTEGKERDFDDVWVRIVGENATVFASGIRNARLGGSIMTYTFPEAGGYELSARFQKDGEKIAEATFPLTVLLGDTKTTEPRFSNILVALFGIFAGAVFGFGVGSVLTQKQYQT